MSAAGAGTGAGGVDPATAMVLSGAGASTAVTQPIPFGMEVVRGSRHPRVTEVLRIMRDVFPGGPGNLCLVTDELMAALQVNPSRVFGSAADRAKTVLIPLFMEPSNRRSSIDPHLPAVANFLATRFPAGSDASVSLKVSTVLETQATHIEAIHQLCGEYAIKHLAGKDFSSNHRAVALAGLLGSFTMGLHFRVSAEKQVEHMRKVKKFITTLQSRRDLVAPDDTYIRDIKDAAGSVLSLKTSTVIASDFSQLLDALNTRMDAVIALLTPSVVKAREDAHTTFTNNILDLLKRLTKILFKLTYFQEPLAFDVHFSKLAQDCHFGGSIDQASKFKAFLLFRGGDNPFDSCIFQDPERRRKEWISCLKEKSQDADNALVQFAKASTYPEELRALNKLEEISHYSVLRVLVEYNDLRTLGLDKIADPSGAERAKLEKLNILHGKLRGITGLGLKPDSFNHSRLFARFSEGSAFVFAKDASDTEEAGRSRVLNLFQRVGILRDGLPMLVFGAISLSGAYDELGSTITQTLSAITDKVSAERAQTWLALLIEALLELNASLSQIFSQSSGSARLSAPLSREFSQFDRVKSSIDLDELIRFIASCKTILFNFQGLQDPEEMAKSLRRGLAHLDNYRAVTDLFNFGAPLPVDDGRGYFHLLADGLQAQGERMREDDAHRGIDDAAGMAAVAAIAPATLEDIAEWREKEKEQQLETDTSLVLAAGVDLPAALDATVDYLRKLARAGVPVEAGTPAASLVVELVKNFKILADKIGLRGDTRLIAEHAVRRTITADPGSRPPALTGGSAAYGVVSSHPPSGSTVTAFAASAGAGGGGAGGPSRPPHRGGSDDPRGGSAWGGPK